MRCHLPFSKKTYGDFLNYVRLLRLYVKIKDKTKNWKLKYVRKILNWNMIASLYLFLILVFTGINNIFKNMNVLYQITKFSSEDLSKDTSVGTVMYRVHYEFNIFLIFIILYISFIIVYTLMGYKKNNVNVK